MNPHPMGATYSKRKCSQTYIFYVSLFLDLVFVYTISSFYSSSNLSSYKMKSNFNLLHLIKKTPNNPSIYVKENSRIDKAPKVNKIRDKTSGEKISMLF